MMATVTGLIAVAVGNKEVIARHQGQTSVALSLLLFGGPVLFLLAQGWYLWTVLCVPPRSQLAGSIALVLMGCIALMTPPYLAMVLGVVALVVLVVINWWHSSDQDVMADLETTEGSE